jgi:hypothetical protein
MKPLVQTPAPSKTEQNKEKEKNTYTKLLKEEE